MFSRTRITTSTGTYSDNIGRLKKALAEVDTVVIGAGAGLSTSAGFVYKGERFEQYFIIFRICIPAVSILTRHRKNSGHTGAGISGLTAI